VRNGELLMLCWLSDCYLVRCVDCCADRGRRAVRQNGGLNRRKRCDDVGVPTVVFSDQRSVLWIDLVEIP